MHEYYFNLDMALILNFDNIIQRSFVDANDAKSTPIYFTYMMRNSLHEQHLLLLLSPLPSPFFPIHPSPLTSLPLPTSNSVSLWDKGTFRANRISQYCFNSNVIFKMHYYKKTRWRWETGWGGDRLGRGTPDVGRLRVVTHSWSGRWCVLLSYIFERSINLLYR